jgi:hypothetical protein
MDRMNMLDKQGFVVLEVADMAFVPCGCTVVEVVRLGDGATFPGLSQVEFNMVVQLRRMWNVL